MARYLLLALNGPTSAPGDEEDYNTWYDTIHVPDLLAVNGVNQATRYKVIQSNLPWPYVNAYEIETDDLAKVMHDMEHGMRPFPPTFDRQNSAHIVAIALDRPDA